MDQVGLLTCARYAFAPNNLSYCGPAKQNDLQGYLQMQVADQGLSEIINEFETLYPYLRLIAQENNIRDPFDRKAVEAYWLGNNLLKNVKLKSLVLHLSDTLNLKKKLSRKKHSQLMDDLHLGFPHHTYHVLNIFMRTGHHAIEHTLETMDSCRVGHGKVNKFSIFNDQFSNNKERFVEVTTRPLVYEDDKLKLGKSIVKKLQCEFGKYKAGDIVTSHWGVVCEKINKRQEKNLELYTQKAIDAVNLKHTK